jgi:branched-chain amino acid transport system permease protein
MKPDFFAVLISPAALGIVALLVLLPLALPSFYLHLAILSLVYVALALSWNIIGGVAGQLSLAHSLFFAIGGIFSIALALRTGLNMWAAIGVASLLSATVAVIISWLNFRFRLGALSFALITLCFAEMTLILVLNSEYLGGASGFYLPKDTGQLSRFEFGSAKSYYWLILGLALLTQIVNLGVLNSPLGYFLRALRDNEAAAQAIGVAVLRNRAAAMVISGLLCTWVGAAYARYSVYVDPYLFASPTLTIEIVLFVTVGGLGTGFGPALGALVLLPLGELLRAHLGGWLPGVHYIVYGVAVILIIMLRPTGIAPAIERFVHRARRGKAAGHFVGPSR